MNDLHPFAPRVASTPKLMSSKPAHWLMKSEPDCFSIHHLADAPKQTTYWSGVRNYQARNYMKAMQVGDRVLYYHSSADPPAVAGTAVVVRQSYPDFTALDPKDDHYDPKATTDNPIWEMVDIRLEQIFATPVPIGTLRGVKALAGMELLKQGSRLSVQPVTPGEFAAVLKLAAGMANGPSEKSPAKKPAAKKPAQAKARTTSKTSQAGR